jgi:hypothetical protein
MGNLQNNQPQNTTPNQPKKDLTKIFLKKTTTTDINRISKSMPPSTKRNTKTKCEFESIKQYVECPRLKESIIYFKTDLEKYDTMRINLEAAIKEKYPALSNINTDKIKNEIKENLKKNSVRKLSKKDKKDPNVTDLNVEDQLEFYKDVSLMMGRFQNVKFILL